MGISPPPTPQKKYNPLNMEFKFLFNTCPVSTPALQTTFNLHFQNICPTWPLLLTIILINAIEFRRLAHENKLTFTQFLLSLG